MRITDFRPRQSKEGAEAGLRILRAPQAARVALHDDRIIGPATWTATSRPSAPGGATPS